MSLAGKNLLDAPEPTLLEEEPQVRVRIEAGDEGEDLSLIHI